MKTAQQLAEILSELVIFLELNGDNPFKIKAYQNAARLLEGSSQTLSELHDQPPAGFGKGLQEKIREFLQTGAIKDHLDLQEATPPGLLDLLRVQGLGPKKVRILHQTLGIDGLDRLEYAIRQNLLLDLKGFGAKTQENIRQGLAFLRQGSGKFLLIEAEAGAVEMKQYLESRFPEVPLEIAGSIRRRKEVVKDVDILAGIEVSTDIMHAFVTHPAIERVLSHGDTKSSVVLRNSLQIDLRVVPPAVMGTALCHFTGSREHNTRLRAWALAQGKKLNEYGIHQGDRSLACHTEAEVFQELGLQPIPPELREDLGEIEWAAEGRQLNLVTDNDIKGILHVHTTASDGRATLEQISQEAASLGYSYVGICDHSRSAYYAGGLSIEAIRNQWDAITELNRRRTGAMLLKGIECDIKADGTLDYPDEILAGFEFIIGSIHSHFSLTADEMTERLIKATTNPFLDILGHISGRILLEREGYPFHYDRVLDACAAAGTIVEINSNPRRLDIDWRHIRSGGGRNLFYSVSVDAHDLPGLADSRFGVGVARKGALDPEHIVNTRSIQEFRAFIQQRRHR